MAQSFEYKVVELREGMVGGKMSGVKLEKTLNEHGRLGWQLKAVTAVEIKGVHSGESGHPFRLKADTRSG